MLSEDSPIQDLEAAKKYLKIAASDNAQSQNLKCQSSINKSTSNAKFQIEAQNLLGECFEIGSSSHSDLETAAFWYLQASKAGHARATFNLGNLYEIGQGVTKDFKKAVHLYKEAIIRGSEEAKIRIEELQELDLV